jgi:NAD(P)-dependent dehydrogenase (short-subunit alcohol dehydrogenase family)
MLCLLFSYCPVYAFKTTKDLHGISKATLNALTRKLAAELRDTGILVNAIDPGWVAADMGGHGGHNVEERA